MKKILLAVMACILVAGVTVLISMKETKTPHKSDPSKFGPAAETWHEEEAFCPFPVTEKAYMVNHGEGWWYVPYTGEKLELALAAFEKHHPGFVRDGYLHDIAMRSRYDSALPLDRYDYDPSKGTFVLYYRVRI